MWKRPCCANRRATILDSSRCASREWKVVLKSRRVGSQASDDALASTSNAGRLARTIYESGSEHVATGARRWQCDAVGGRTFPENALLSCHVIGSSVSRRMESTIAPARTIERNAEDTSRRVTILRMVTKFVGNIYTGSVRLNEPTSSVSEGSDLFFARGGRKFFGELWASSFNFTYAITFTSAISPI
jgi:hypothetical protein